MFRRRPGATAPTLLLPSVAPNEPGHAVADAEQIVRDAWTAHLSEQHNRAEAALQAANAQCDAAYKRLAAAQRGRDPKKIALAHTALETALVAQRRSEMVCERTHEAFLAELDLLGRACAVRALARQLEGGDLPAGDGHVDTSSLPLRLALSGLGAARRFRRWLGRLSAPRAANRLSR
jgi:hypothetical protein